MARTHRGKRLVEAVFLSLLLFTASACNLGARGPGDPDREPGEPDIQPETTQEAG